MKYLTFRLDQSHTCHHVLSYIDEQYRNTAILKQNKTKGKICFFTPQIWNTIQLPTTSQPAILKKMVHLSLSQANIKQMSRLGPTPNHNGAPWQPYYSNAPDVTVVSDQSQVHNMGTMRTLSQRHNWRNGCIVHTPRTQHRDFKSSVIVTQLAWYMYNARAREWHFSSKAVPGDASGTPIISVGSPNYLTDHYSPIIYDRGGQTMV